MNNNTPAQNTSDTQTNTSADQTQTQQQPATNVSAEQSTSTSGATSASKETTAPATTTKIAGVVEVKLDGFMYGYSVKEIRVKKGDVVKIDFTSTDGFHDWVIDEFNARTEKVNTGGNTSVTFTADKTGTFEYYCSVGKHRANGMVGKLIVE